MIVSRMARPKAISKEIETLIRESFGGGVTGSGVSVNSDTAMQQATVYSCVKVLSQSISQMPVHLMERTGKGKDAVTEKAIEHRLYRLLHDQPNSWMTAPELWGMCIAYNSLVGDFLAFKITYNGEVRELIPINHSRVMEIRQNPDWSLTYKIANPDGGYKEYSQYQIFHVRGLSINGYSSLNPIAYFRETIGVGKASEKFKAQYFGKGMQPGAVIKHPASLNAPAYKDLKQRLKEKYSGLGQSWDLMLLDEGMGIEFPQIKLVDAQFLENEKFTQSQIASLFRVPLMLIQAGDAPTTYASSEQFMLAFVTHALTPLVVNIEKAIYRDLLTEEEKGRYYAKFNMAGLLRGDMKSSFEAWQIGVNTEILCPNEPREMLELNPYPEGWEFRTRTSTVKQDTGNKKGDANNAGQEAA